MCRFFLVFGPALWLLFFVVNESRGFAQASPLLADELYLYTPVRVMSEKGCERM